MAFGSGAAGALARRGGPEHLRIEGIEDLKKTLGDFLPREANNILRRTITKVAANIRNDMRQAAPKDQGVLRRAIVSRRERGTPDSVEAGVYITHGKGQKNDAWYWHFVEWGTEGYRVGEKRRDFRGKSHGIVRRNIAPKKAQPFIKPTVEKWRPKISAVFREELGPQIEREIAKRARRQQR